MMKIGITALGVAVATLACVVTTSACAVEQATGGGDNSAELAKKLANPIASLISVPVKLDWDTGIGPARADRSTYVVQPVIPFSLNSEWNHGN